MLSLIRFYASPDPLFDQDTILPCPGASGHHVPRVDHQNMWQHQTLLVTSAWSQRERNNRKWNWMKQVWFCVTVSLMPAFHGHYCSFGSSFPSLPFGYNSRKMIVHEMCQLILWSFLWLEIKNVKITGSQGHDISIMKAILKRMPTHHPEVEKMCKSLQDGC